MLQRQQLLQLTRSGFFLYSDNLQFGCLSTRGLWEVRPSLTARDRTGRPSISRL